MFAIIFCFFSLFMSLSMFCFVSFFLYKKRQLLREELEREARESPALGQSLSRVVEKTREECEKSRAQLTHSLLLEILPNDSAKWARLLAGEGCGGTDSGGSGAGDGSVDYGDSGLGGDGRAKKKKRRSRKKKANCEDGSGSVDAGDQRGDSSGLDGGSRLKEELVCLYPFTSSSSATQRKIKQQYDQLVKSQESKGLTLAQVGQFANCLAEARNELQQKSEAIQRKFTITKALLFKADRSSFDRIRQQIYKLELEQKRLEEDAFVYNWLQQQLKLSPLYQKMLETDACTDSNAKFDDLTESTDTEFDDISFEELLAQEKKDSFWQKNGRRRSCSS